MIAVPKKLLCVYFNLIDPDVEPLYVHEGVFLPVLSALEGIAEILDLVLVVLLSLQGLLLRDLKFFDLSYSHMLPYSFH